MNNYLEIKNEILNKIKEYDSIIILRHVKPDGDCMGSTLGLRQILRDSFPNKRIYSIGKMKSSYLEFLGSEDEDVSDEVYQNSLIIVVDTATKDRIDNDKFELGKETIKIDHHIAVDDYANINYVREDLPATCSIIVDFYNTFKDELILSEEASKYLFVGIVTDTGRFRYRGISGDVFRLTGMLLDKEIDTEDIFSNLYIKSEEELKLTAYIYKHFKVTKNGVAYFKMSKKIQKKFSVTNEAASSLVNVLEGIRGSLIWIFFIQNKEKIWRVRLRSRFASVNQIAQKYRGGGHLQASGATVYNKKEMKQLLFDADKALAEYKVNNPGAY
jgi:phosphoesterase RecJ-like protein